MSLWTCIFILEVFVFPLSMICLLIFELFYTMYIYFCCLHFFIFHSYTETKNKQVRFAIKKPVSMFILEKLSNESSVLYIQCSDWIIFINLSMKLILDRLITASQILIYFFLFDIKLSIIFFYISDCYVLLMFPYNSDHIYILFLLWYYWYNKTPHYFYSSLITGRLITLTAFCLYYTLI